MPYSMIQKEKLKQLGERVKAVRTANDQTLKELAFKINKDPQSIHRLEVGGINPTFLYLSEVCDGLNIDITELLSEL